MKQVHWILLLLTIILLVLVKFTASFWIALGSIITGFLFLVLFFKNYFDNRS